MNENEIERLQQRLIREAVRNPDTNNLIASHGKRIWFLAGNSSDGWVVCQTDLISDTFDVYGIGPKRDNGTVDVPLFAIRQDAIRFATEWLLNYATSKNINNLYFKNRIHGQN